MPVPTNLAERAQQLAVQLADPDVDDAGIELNNLIRELRQADSFSLRESTDEVHTAMLALGPAGERAVSWLARHAAAFSTHEERARAAFWRATQRNLTAVAV